jgi:hypothetical protein
MAPIKLYCRDIGKGGVSGIFYCSKRQATQHKWKMENGK